MKRRITFSAFLCLLIFLLMASTSTLAQEPLQETYVMPGGVLAFDYPAGWLLQEGDNSVRLASGEAVFPDGVAQSGDILMEIQPPAFLSSNAFYGSTPAETLNLLLAQRESAENDTSNSAPEELVLGDKPAASSVGELDSQAVLRVVIEFWPGYQALLTAITPVGELEAAQAMVMAIAESIRLPQGSGPSMGLVTESADGMREIRQWATNAVASSEYSPTSNSALQATGLPDAPGCGDSSSAWTPETLSEQATITLTYLIPVVPTEIKVYQNYTPGTITGIQVLPADGSDAIAIPDSANTGITTCPHVFTLTLPPDLPPVIGVTIEIDQSEAQIWSEIDAVQLIGQSDLLIQWATGANATSEYTPDAWNAMQASGEPNTLRCGDYRTAWASASSTGVDTLTLNYSQPLVPKMVLIYQTFNPGAITQVDLVTPEGEVISLPDSGNPEAPCPGIFRLSFPENMPPINGVIIHLDQTLTQSWNEIDAVGIVGRPAE